MWQLVAFFFSAQFYCHVDKGHDDWHHRIRGFCKNPYGDGPSIWPVDFKRGIIEMEKTWPGWPLTYKRTTKNDNMNWNSQLVWLNSIATCNTFVPWLKSGASVPHFQMAGLGGSPLRCLASQLERRLVTNCCCTLVPHFWARSIIWLLLLLLLFCCCCCCCCCCCWRCCSVAAVVVVAVVALLLLLLLLLMLLLLMSFFGFNTVHVYEYYIYIHVYI